ncbi:MAG: lipoate--protein ligase family protein [Chloroflexi bacterium]|nr:lipoate--protein ligase family protein [Chloroflexota bacterium]
MSTLRLLPLLTADTATQMAIDEALMEAVATSAASPTLRFYDWAAPAVSLGAAQPAAQVDRHACARRGIAIVRRASGGSAVLHGEQVGFTFALPADYPLVAGDLVASYERFGRLLLDVLMQLGIGADLIPLAEARSTRPRGLLSAACFAGYGPFEPRYQGRKLAGSAQVRRRGVVLHHGLIPLEFRAEDLAAVLTGTVAERHALAAELDRRIGSLAWACGRTVTAGEVVCAWCAAVERGGIAPRAGELTAPEWERAAALRADKYVRDEWTFRQ